MSQPDSSMSASNGAPLAAEIVKERMFAHTHTHDATTLKRSRMTRLNATDHAKENFLEPTMFPLHRKDGHGGPSYCHQLNFDASNYRLPTSFSAEDRSNRLDLADEGRVVKYVGPGRTDSDAAAVRASLPLPPQIGIYYYETTVVSKGRDGYISVGFAIKSSSLSRLTGWEPGTVGYHADDGNLYRGAGTGMSFGPSYTTGDTVGCGVNFVDRSFFFTKNGILIGEVTNLKDKFHLPFFPCVGCRTPGEVIAGNFGIDGGGAVLPFVFDIDSHVERRLRSRFGGDKLPCMQHERLVLAYLVHCGFQQSALALFNSIAAGANEETERRELLASFESARNRRLVVDAVRTGETAQLFSLLKQHYPAFLMEHPDVAFRLECLVFVELVRSLQKLPPSSGIDDSRVADNANGASVAADDDSLQQILDAGQRLSVQFSAELTERHASLLRDAFALVAYTQPQHSPVGYLLQRPFRMELAVVLDEALLLYEGKPAVSSLHRVLQQCQATMDELQYMEDPEVALLHV